MLKKSVYDYYGEVDKWLAVKPSVLSRGTRMSGREED